jgi:hypothetical protein
MVEDIEEKRVGENPLKVVLAKPFAATIPVEVI